LSTKTAETKGTVKQQPSPCYLVDPARITLADIVIVCTLIYPFKLVCDEEHLKTYPNTMKWFTTCLKQPEFVTVLGLVDLCKMK